MNKPPQRIGRYEIVNHLGSGGFADVWEARDPNVPTRPIALKVLQEHAANDPGSVERFRREASSQASITHPNVVVIYDPNMDGQPPFIVMEFLPSSLSALLKERGTLPWAKTVPLIRGIASALQAANKLGIVHRDLKPQNILLTDDEPPTPKVADFGLARNEALESFSGTADIMGTVLYMSPEQFTTSRVGIRSDLYTLGVIFYQMLLGKTPLLDETPNPSMSEIMRYHFGPTNPPMLHLDDASIPLRVRTVVQRLLERDPDDRYQTPEELIAELDGLSRNEDQDKQKGQQRNQPRRPSTKRSPEAKPKTEKEDQDKQKSQQPNRPSGPSAKRSPKAKPKAETASVMSLSELIIVAGLFIALGYLAWHFRWFHPVFWGTAVGLSGLVVVTLPFVAADEDRSNSRSRPVKVGLLLGSMLVITLSLAWILGGFPFDRTAIVVDSIDTTPEVSEGSVGATQPAIPTSPQTEQPSTMPAANPTPLVKDPETEQTSTMSAANPTPPATDPAVQEVSEAPPAIPTPTPVQTGVLVDGPTLAQPRMNHQSVLLHDGRVMVIGGSTSTAGGPFLDSVELFDPKNDTWSFASPLNFARDDHTATVLPDGRVLVAGGQGPSSGPTGQSRSSEIYDPTTGEWDIAGDMTYPRAYHSATLLPSGQVLIVGGYAHSERAYSNGEYPSKGHTAEIFDPVSNSFYEIESLKHPRVHHGVVSFAPDYVVVVGGLDNEAMGTAEFLDVRTGKWETAELPCEGRGGWLANDNYVVSLPTYQTLWFARLHPLGQHACSDGLIFSLRDLVLPDSAPAVNTGYWDAGLPYTASAAEGSTALLLDNGNLLLTNGDRLIEMDPLSRRTVVNEGLTQRFPKLIQLTTGEVLIVGGTDATGNPVSATSIYHPLADRPAPVIVYSVSAGTDPALGRANTIYDLYSISLDGVEKRITNTEGSEDYPEVSPDGTRIAFSVNELGTQREIVVTNIDGSGLLRLNENRQHQYASWPTWSPDGSEIAYGDSDGRIWVASSDGTGRRLLSEFGRRPRWSPKNDTLAATCEHRLCFIDINTGDVRRLDIPNASIDVDEGIDWSPDGSQLVFSGNIKISGAGNDEKWSSVSIFRVNTDGTGLTRLTDDTFSESDPAWSADGSLIAFTSNRGDPGLEIYVMNSDGGGQRRLTALVARTGHGSNYMPTWIPD